MKIDNKYLEYAASHFKVPEPIVRGSIRNPYPIETALFGDLTYFESGKSAYLYFNSVSAVADKEDLASIKEAISKVGTLADSSIRGFPCRTQGKCTHEWCLQPDVIPHDFYEYAFLEPDDPPFEAKRHYLWCLEDARLGTDG